ncbi:mechanosensitive ion channel, partial [Patescibacteria group bacterium]|nr:mechanosensitive ion channel [Patescibacteria group bacterium]
GLFVVAASADIWQRIYAAKNNTHARIALGIAAVLFVLFGFGLCGLGIFAKVALPAIDPNNAFVESISQLMPKGLVVVVILFVFGKVILRKIVKRLVETTEDDRTAAHQRAETLGRVVVSIGNVVIYTVILLMVLEMFGVDIRPILAGAGIIGLAVGFGAQSLVKEFVAGLFILIEGQYGVGDKVKIGSTEGEVIRVTLRSTVLKSAEGGTIYLSNGSVNNVVNYSQK